MLKKGWGREVNDNCNQKEDNAHLLIGKCCNVQEEDKC